MEDKGMKPFLESLLNRYGIKYSHLAKSIGVSHATVSRWLTGEDIPNVRSCDKLSAFSSVPLQHILYIAGHIEIDMTEDKDSLPALREYVEVKYPGVFPDEVILVLEGIIDRKRGSQIS